MRTLASLLIAGMMVLTYGCAATLPKAPRPASVNVSGNWVGTWWAYDGEGGSGELRGTLLQDGTVVNGQFVVSGRVVNTTFVAGTVSGSELLLSTPAPGSLLVNGDEMTGVVNGLTPSRITLRKQP